MAATIDRFNPTGIAIERIDRDNPDAIAIGTANVAHTCRVASDARMHGGMTWYPDGRMRRGYIAGDAVLRLRRIAIATAIEHGRDPAPYTYPTIAAVVAVCNTNNGWAESLPMAEKLIVAHASGAKRPPRAGLPMACERAWALLNGAAHVFENIGGKTGNKTWNFWNNLCGRRDFVTIDRWACRAAGLPDSTHQTDRGYELVAECYRRAADELGWTPAEVQAVAWTTYRGEDE